MTRRPLDTPERRAAIHGSAYVSAAKHLARANGVSMTRRRRVGPVVFDVGIRSGDHRAHGTIAFTSEGRLDSVDLFAQHQGWISLVALADVLEFGPLGARASEAVMETSPVEIVLEALPDPETPLTGLIPVVTASTVITVLPAPEAAVERVPALIVADVPSAQPRTLSIPIVMVPSNLTLPEKRPTLRARQEAVREALPSSWQVWRQFTLGVLLVLQLVAYVFLTLVLNQSLNGILITMSVVAATVGVGITGTAIHTNDNRIDALRAVGIR